VASSYLSYAIAQISLVSSIDAMFYCMFAYSTYVDNHKGRLDTLGQR